MREFTNKSLWDNDNQDWCEFYYIDNQEVDFPIFSEQLKVEELATEDDFNVCDECSQCVGCDEHCGRGNHDEEYVNDCEDEELEQENDCDCPECNKNMYLAKSVQFMFKNQLCPQHVFEMLQDVYDKAYDEGFDDGYEEMKDEVRGVLED